MPLHIETFVRAEHLRRSNIVAVHFYLANIVDERGLLKKITVARGKIARQRLALMRTILREVASKDGVRTR